MADNSVPLIAYKQSPRPLSDNDKADLITAKLERHAIALEVLSKGFDSKGQPIKERNPRWHDSNGFFIGRSEK